MMHLRAFASVFCTGYLLLVRSQTNVQQKDNKKSIVLWRLQFCGNILFKHFSSEWNTHKDECQEKRDRLIEYNLV